MKSKMCKGCRHFFPKGSTAYNYDVCNWRFTSNAIQRLKECPNGKPEYNPFNEIKITSLEKEIVYVPSVWTAYPSCYDGGPCTNPFFDCINCSRKQPDGSYTKTVNTKKI